MSLRFDNSLGSPIDIPTGLSVHDFRVIGGDSTFPGWYDGFGWIDSEPWLDSSADVWTLAYDGISVYGQLTNPWVPTGPNWEINFTAFFKDIIGGVSSVNNETIFSFGTNDYSNTRYPFIRNDLSGDILADTITIGNLTTSGVFTYSLDDSQDSISFASYETVIIGALPLNNGLSRRLTGQVHRIELIDNDTPSNSIVINNLIASETQPTDFNIYNELTGQVIGSYFNGVYELAEGI